ncbi:unnamed protein product [Medioppia subpectinata]|uniref:15-oxoprostaglandin 13-reductase n=1 Tax=Medioppia subpectinata TaxID=1979941 RepID=A0A7R9Q1M7_9ACAR|nr:unnamed protein product [Medioppia subpectinata]CAG2109398.1 unnamed protein product [Medioppia subpectinata]
MELILWSEEWREAVKVLCEPLVPPQDNEILVKTVYAGVNATDVITYQFGGNGVGYEALGVIEAVGKNVTDFTAGQTVIFLFGVDYNFRGFSEYIYAKSEELTAVPCLKPELLSLPVCGITAAIGLDNAGFIKKTDKVLVTAAAGGTGMVAVQWAKQKGCYVIGMTSTEEKVTFLKELGTDRVINYKTENLDEVLTKEFPEGVDVIWETIGGQVFETLFKHLALKGRLVLIGGTASYKSETNDVNNTLNIPNASNYAKSEELTPVPSLKPEFIALPVNAMTASIGLDVAGFIKKTDKVLVTAAAGGTGLMAVQWAKQKGSYVIGMTSTEEKTKLLKELGTDRVINYKTENLDEVLTKEFPEGVDVIWETIGGQVLVNLYNHLAPMGRLVIVGGTPNYKDEDNNDNILKIPDLALRV